MEEIINKVFGDTYQIKNIKKEGVLLIKKESKSSKAIFISLTTTSYSINIDAVIGLYKNEKVEQLLAPVLKNNKIKYTHFGNWDCTLNKFIRYEGEEIAKENLGELELELKKLQSEFNDIEESFFAKYNTIENISVALKGLNEEQLSETVSNPVLIRRLVIDFLAGSTKDLESDCKSIVGEYKEAEELYPHIFKNHAEAARELCKVLKSL